MRKILFLLVSVILLLPSGVSAQELSIAQEYIAKAKVVEASPSRTEYILGTEVETKVQDITVEVLEGRDIGLRASFRNDFTQVQTGDTIYVRHTVSQFDPEMWSVADPYRLDVLIVIAVVFVLLLFLFGGWQGIRGLASLIGSFVLIFYLLIPNLYAGHSPILVSLGVASLIIVVGSYITHGFNRTTTLAMFGMVLTIIVTGIATYFAIDAAELSGFTSEENVYLNFNTGGRIDMVGLLFGAIMIGLLGVLYDIAIGQAVTVEELVAAGAHYTREQVFARAMRVGREHIGALVNTLAIAYVGAALPLLLLFQSSETNIPHLLNSELFATELIRILMGSIGLVLAVPITTLLTTYALYGKEVQGRTTHTHT